MNIVNHIPPPPRNVGNTTGLAIGQRVGQVEIQIANLRTVTEEAFHLTNELETRTFGVTRMEPVEVDPNAKDMPLETLVPTADQIREITRTIDANNNRLRSLLGRIEL